MVSGLILIKISLCDSTQTMCPNVSSDFQTRNGLIENVMINFFESAYDILIKYIILYYDLSVDVYDIGS